MYIIGFGGGEGNELNSNIAVFLKWSKLPLNSENLRNHRCRNKVHFKDPLCYLCLHGAVVAC